MHDRRIAGKNTQQRSAQSITHRHSNHRIHHSLSRTARTTCLAHRLCETGNQKAADDICCCCQVMENGAKANSANRLIDSQSAVSPTSNCKIPPAEAGANKPVHHHQYQQQMVCPFAPGGRQPQSFKIRPIGGAIRPNAAEFAVGKLGKNITLHTSSPPGRSPWSAALARPGVDDTVKQPIQQVHPVGRQQPDPKAVIHTPSARPYNRRNPVENTLPAKMVKGVRWLRQDLFRCGTENSRSSGARNNKQMQVIPMLVKERHGVFRQPGLPPGSPFAQTGRTLCPGTGANHLGNRVPCKNHHRQRKTIA